MNDNAIRFIRNILLAFVLITIGFALGKESTLRSIRRSSSDTPAKPASGRVSPVIVYYVHATIRCDTCNTIEKMTHNALTSQFADALADGRIEWKVADFQVDEELAKRYQVVSSGVIVARTSKGGKESYRSLDDVWTLISDPPAFEKYIAEGVREYLSAASKEENEK